MYDFTRLEPCVCDAGCCYPTHPDNVDTFCAHDGPVVVREQIEDRDAEIERLRAEVEEWREKWAREFELRGELAATIERRIADASQRARLPDSLKKRVSPDEIEYRRADLVGAEIERLHAEVKFAKSLEREWHERYEAERQRARLPDELVERLREHRDGDTWMTLADMDALARDILAAVEGSRDPE